jgi:hypothetical protein
MNTVSPAPEDGLEKNLCPCCGSGLHLHICAICQTVTSCRYCNQPFHAIQRRADYALPKIGPDRVAFRMARNMDRLHRRVKAANASAQRSEAAPKNEPAPQPPNRTEPSRSAAASIEQSEIAPQQPAAAVNDPGRVSNANAPDNIGMGREPAFAAGNAGASGDLAAPGSKKWRLAVALLLLASGVVAGYYTFTPKVQTSPASAMKNTAGTVTGTGASVPTAGREARGDITQKPQVADGGKRPQENIMKEPGRPVAVKAAGSHPALPVQGKESEHAQPAATNHAPVTASAPVPVPVPVATERLPPDPEVAQAVIGSQAASKSSGSTDVVNSRTGGEGGVRDRAGNATSTATRSGDRPTVRCSTASQALGLCDARTR